MARFGALIEPADLYNKLAQAGSSARSPVLTIGSGSRNNPIVARWHSAAIINFKQTPA